VFASTASARLEVDRENHPVHAVVAGRVEAVHAVVGRWVRAGDVIVEFDAASERLARGEEEARLAPAGSQVQLLKEELAAEERALEGERRSAQAGAAQAESERQRAAAASFRRRGSGSSPNCTAEA
jgi:multidrug efflux pump subunit AcrA (membrane-fusion protein)